MFFSASVANPDSAVREFHVDVKRVHYHCRREAQAHGPAQGRYEYSEEYQDEELEIKERQPVGARA